MRFQPSFAVCVKCNCKLFFVHRFLLLLFLLAVLFVLFVLFNSIPLNPILVFSICLIQFELSVLLLTWIFLFMVIYILYSHYVYIWCWFLIPELFAAAVVAVFFAVFCIFAGIWFWFAFLFLMWNIYAETIH